MAPHLRETVDERSLLGGTAKGSSKISSKLLLVSVLLNFVSLFVLAKLLVESKQLGDPLISSENQNKIHEWWNQAVAEAGKASAMNCSGHGRVYVDTLKENACECNNCFTGKDCSQKIVDCKADADGGDPLYLEPYWEMNPEAGAVLISPAYRMSYSASESGAQTEELELLIRQIHDFVGNAVTKDRFIVIGTGSMELVNAAVASLSSQATSSSPAVVVSGTPYYSAYETQTKFFSSTKYFWGGDSVKAAAKFSNTNSSFVELVAAPNNPDASMNDAVLSSSVSSAIYDRAYYWPHYTPISKAVDDDLSLFTLSKLTGHAGSRLGWAIVKDPEVYRRIYEYVRLNTLGVSHDSQLRAAKLIKAILAGYEAAAGDGKKHLFHFAQAVMKSRWERLNEAFGQLKQFSLQKVEPKSCVFFKDIVWPSPAYAWVKCEDEAITDCYQFFWEAGIMGRSGPEFGSDKKHVRFTLLKRNDDFDNFIAHLRGLSK